MVGYEGDIPAEIKTILFDPQTAGGLLLSVASKGAGRLESELRAAGVAAGASGLPLFAAGGSRPGPRRSTMRLATVLASSSSAPVPRRRG